LFIFFSFSFINLIFFSSFLLSFFICFFCLSSVFGFSIFFHSLYLLHLFLFFVLTFYIFCAFETKGCIPTPISLSINPFCSPSTYFHPEQLNTSFIALLVWKFAQIFSEYSVFCQNAATTIEHFTSRPICFFSARTSRKTRIIL
jgi:hypothetical protein